MVGTVKAFGYALALIAWFTFLFLLENALLRL